MTLTNGIDILISATPFILDRVLGLGWTNLERLRTLVFDNGYLLMEKYFHQVREFYRSYEMLLRNNDWLSLAQIVCVTPNWSNKVGQFVERVLATPVILCEDKLEAAFYGKVHHVLMECDSTHEKVIL